MAAPFVTSAEVDAGEKLRSDYTRGRLMPRLGANWEAAVAPGRRGAGGGRGRPDRCGTCRAPAGGPGAGRRRPRTGRRADRRLLLPEGARTRGTGTRLAGAVGQGGSEDGAWRAEPALSPRSGPPVQARRCCTGAPKTIGRNCAERRVARVRRSRAAPRRRPA